MAQDLEMQMHMLMMQQMVEDSQWLDNYQNRQLKHVRKERQSGKIEVLQDGDDDSEAPSSTTNSTVCDSERESTFQNVAAKRSRWMMSESFKRSLSANDLEDFVSRAQRDPSKQPPIKQRAFDFSLRDSSAEVPAAAFDFSGAFEANQDKVHACHTTKPFSFAAIEVPQKPSEALAGSAKRSSSLVLDTTELHDLPAPEFVDEGRSQVLRGTMALFTRAWSCPTSRHSQIAMDTPNLQIEEVHE